MQKLRADSVLGRAGQLFTPLGGYAARDHAPTSYQYLNQGRVPSSSIQSVGTAVYTQPPPRPDAACPAKSSSADESICPTDAEGKRGPRQCVECVGLQVVL